MARPHLRLQDDRTLAAAGRSQPGDPLGRLPVGDAGIVQASGHQQRGIIGRPHVVVGRVALDVAVELGLRGIAPLVVFIDGQGQLVIEHGRERVDKRHLGHGAREQVRSLVQHGPDQQAPGAAAADGQPRRNCVALGHQLLRASDEVVERVAFVQQFAVVVPLPPHLAPAPHVRDRKNKTSIEKTQPRGIEHRVVGMLVGAVPIQQQR